MIVDHRPTLLNIRVLRKVFLTTTLKACSPGFVPSRRIQSRERILFRPHLLAPLKNSDVPRSIHTDLDVMQEKRIDDYRNVDANRSLSDSWKMFTNFTLLKETP